VSQVYLKVNPELLAHFLRALLALPGGLVIALVAGGLNGFVRALIIGRFCTTFVKVRPSL